MPGWFAQTEKPIKTAKGIRFKGLGKPKKEVKAQSDRARKAVASLVPGFEKPVHVTISGYVQEPTDSEPNSVHIHIFEVP